MSTPGTMPQIPRARLLVIFLAVNLLVLVLGILIGRSLTTTEGEAARTAQKHITTSAQVERRAVGQSVTAQGTVRTGNQSTYTPELAGDRSVVTSTQVNAGDALSPGRLIATVSDRPIITIPTEVRLYRNLSIGDDGSDARGLNAALRSWGYPAEGGSRWSEASHRAYLAFLRDQGYAPGDEQAVIWKDFYPVPGDGSLTVQSIAGEGEELTEEKPLLTARTGATVITARVDLGTADTLHTGDQVTVRASGEDHQSTITGISGFQEGEHPGKDLTLTMPEGAQAGDAGQVVVTVTPAVEPSLAVPVTALRLADGQESVLLEDGQRSVPVQVLRQADGWAALAPTDQLQEGASVVLSR